MARGAWGVVREAAAESLGRFGGASVVKSCERWPQSAVVVVNGKAPTRRSALDRVRGGKSRRLGSFFSIAFRRRGGGCEGAERRVFWFSGWGGGVELPKRSLNHEFWRG